MHFVSLFSCSKCGFTAGGKTKVPTSFPKIDKIYIFAFISFFDFFCLGFIFLLFLICFSFVYCFLGLILIFVFLVIVYLFLFFNITYSLPKYVFILCFYCFFGFFSLFFFLYPFFFNCVSHFLLEIVSVLCK